jgi:hypothetical protein
MSAIRTMCPSCISPIDLEPTEVLLLPAPTAAGTGSYAFYCGSCRRVTVAAATRTEIALLVTAGVHVEEDPSASRPVDPAPSGDPFTLDDLIEFHLLLDTEDWFARLTARAEHRA